MCETKVYVKHNAEIAHRLSLLQGKCQNIHGHSLQVQLWLLGPTDERGIMGGLDFGTIKKKFREYIDEMYDHHLLLNKEDQLLDQLGHTAFGAVDIYPGLVTTIGDPTIENIAKWVHTWASQTFTPLLVRVNVQETNTNGAEVGF
jgi:6-pyruvoyltetrahydropterin/6-carboxytetrahydropterin synthase